mmetsp:Transcript_114671/g.307442  ORF Transcript_114671/g.307442 Transcript_114671/m.307442 type:complete len:205 (-) Transcript_114671:226-840(-)
MVRVRGLPGPHARQAHLHGQGPPDRRVVAEAPRPRPGVRAPRPRRGRRRARVVAGEPRARQRSRHGPRDDWEPRSGRSARPRVPAPELHGLVHRAVRRQRPRPLRGHVQLRERVASLPGVPLLRRGWSGEVRAGRQGPVGDRGLHHSGCLLVGLRGAAHARQPPAQGAAGAPLPRELVRGCRGHLRGRQAQHPGRDRRQAAGGR